MNEIKLDKYKNAWKMKSDSFFRNNKLSDSGIKNFLNGKSRDISKLYKRGLIVSITFISFIAISLISLSLLFSFKQYILPLVLLGISIISVIFQVRLLHRIPKYFLVEDNLKHLLEEKIYFYKTHYKKSILIGGISAPLFFLTGMLFYFFFVYGKVRIFALDDYLVFGVGVVLSYFITVVSQMWQFNYQLKQLQNCLDELNDEIINNLSIKKHKINKMRLVIMSILALIIGILLFLYIIWR